VAKDIKGVKSVLGGLLSPSGPAKTDEAEPKAQPAQATAPDPAPQASEATTPAAPPARAQAAKTSVPAKSRAARRGRPPGRGTGEGGTKEKVTIRISKELMDKFRDRSWDERCQVGELVEKAMLLLEKQWAKQAKE